jgi:hypothetical protein
MASINTFTESAEVSAAADEKMEDALASSSLVRDRLHEVSDMLAALYSFAEDNAPALEQEVVNVQQSLQGLHTTMDDVFLAGEEIRRQIDLLRSHIAGLIG